MNVEVSILMSEYNTDKDVLERAIASMLNQTFKAFEFIIVNDHSNTDLEGIVDKFNDKRIKIINNEKNLGLSLSLNEGLKVANGKYIVRMDTDDISFPDRIEKELKFIKDNEEYDFVAMNAYLIDENGRYGKTNNSGEIKKENIIYSNIIIHPTIIMKTDVLRKLGGYLNYKRCEDYDLWCRALCQGCKIYIMPDVGIEYRVRVNDYKKRGIRYRKDLIKVKYNYLKSIKAPISSYNSILKEIAAGIVPKKAMKAYHKKKFKVKE